MGYNPEKFANTDLVHIGKQMAFYYRKTYDEKDPKKREEKINEKYNSLVCVYSKNDWATLNRVTQTKFSNFNFSFLLRKEN